MLPFPIGEQSTVGTFIGVGVGISMFLLFLILIMVVIIMVVVVARRKAVYKQNRDVIVGDNLHYNNTVVAEHKMELKEKGVGADYKDADGYEDADKDNDEDEDPFEVGFDPYEVVDRKVHTKNAKKPAPRESAPTASATNASAVYAVVDKSKKTAKKETEVESTATNNDQYAMPMRKNMGKMTDKGEGVVEIGGVEEEQYDDTVGFKYETKADSKSWQPIEGSFKC